MFESSLERPAPRPAVLGVAPLARFWSRIEPGRWRQALWHRRSVRVQLLIVFIVIDLIAALVAGSVTILKARTSTRVEIAASMELAELLVREAVTLMQQEVPAEQFLTDLSSRLRLIRHVRIAVRDAAGHPLPVPAAMKSEAMRGDERTPAPSWFAALIAPSLETRNVPVLVNGAAVGAIEIVSEPKDEIAEVWENTVALAAAALLLNLGMIAVLYVLFGRVLDPLTGLASGLTNLEQKNYQVRLPQPQARELAAISERFNMLAAALDALQADNLRLNHRLITAQDDERRRTALELHDEVGPSLFGLKANAASIATAAGDLADPAGRNVKARVADIFAIVEHLQTINRSLLNRLRPMALGHVPLRDILAEMVSERARQHPQIAFAFTPKAIARGYGDSIDLTIYRCVQESLTNAIRHAQPRRIDIDIDLGEADDGTCISLTVRDDGQGIAPDTAPGFGLLGMQERVQALGGEYRIAGAPGRGTCVCVTIPLRPERSLPEDAIA